MRLHLVVPQRVVVDGAPVTAVIAEGREGSFAILPRHVDYATSLRPGILVYRDPEGTEVFLGVDRGILVKVGEEVRVSVRHAIQDERLETLRPTVDARFLALDERERQARSALANLETRFLRRFVEQLERAGR